MKSPKLVGKLIDFIVKDLPFTNYIANFVFVWQKKIRSY